MTGAGLRPTRPGITTRLRPWVRAMHRDAGYFVVGLTIIYALSGLAVNHIADWDPSFSQVELRYQLPMPLPRGDAAIAELAATDLGIDREPQEVFRVDDTSLDVLFEERTLHIDTTTGVVQVEGQEPRFFLRLANWLHLNRGKRAWTFIADGYAILLLCLAFSGLFMIKGRKGLIGRGGVIAGLGVLVPVVYVVLSGGP